MNESCFTRALEFWFNICTVLTCVCVVEKTGHDAAAAGEVKKIKSETHLSSDEQQTQNKSKQKSADSVAVDAGSKPVPVICKTFVFCITSAVQSST